MSAEYAYSRHRGYFKGTNDVDPEYWEDHPPFEKEVGRMGGIVPDGIWIPVPEKEIREISYQPEIPLYTPEDAEIPSIKRPDEGPQRGVMIIEL